VRVVCIFCGVLGSCERRLYSSTVRSILANINVSWIRNASNERKQASKSTRTDAHVRRDLNWTTSGICFTFSALFSFFSFEAFTLQGFVEYLEVFFFAAPKMEFCSEAAYGFN